MKTILLGTAKTAETKTDCEKQKDCRTWSNKSRKWNSVPGRPATLQQINLLAAAASTQAVHTVHSSTRGTGHSLSQETSYHTTVCMESRQAAGSTNGYLYKWLIFSFCKVNEGQTKIKSISQQKAWKVLKKMYFNVTQVLPAEKETRGWQLKAFSFCHTQQGKSLCSLVRILNT